VEKHDGEGDLSALVSQSVGIPFTVAFQEPMCLQLTQIVAELIQPITRNQANLYGRAIGNAAPHRFLPGGKGGLYGWERVRPPIGRGPHPDTWGNFGFDTRQATQLPQSGLVQCLLTGKDQAIMFAISSPEMPCSWPVDHPIPQPPERSHHTDLFRRSK
jgi:hypothetical protein